MISGPEYGILSWLIVLARRRDLAEETIFLIVDPGGEEEFVSLACRDTIPKD